MTPLPENIGKKFHGVIIPTYDLKSKGTKPKKRKNDIKIKSFCTPMKQLTTVNGENNENYIFGKGFLPKLAHKELIARNQMILFLKCAKDLSRHP